MNILKTIFSKIQAQKESVKIIFPEGNSPKIQEVAKKLLGTKIEPILVFEKTSDVPADLKNSKIHIVTIDTYDTEELAEYLVELRKGKLSIADARHLVKEPNYFSVLKVKKGRADGMVGGITYDTKDIIRPALQIIRPKAGYSLVSSVFLMVKDDKNVIFTDCALNIYPDANQLAQIAKLGKEAATLFNIDNPNIALLSYSTKGSGAGESVDKVREAYNMLKNDDSIKDCVIDGEFQFDSAFDEAVRTKKAPTSPMKGCADVFVFPNLDAGNIGYKIAQRMAGYGAIGPIIIGLDKPVNDLSRGATVEDIYNTAVVTAYLHVLNEK